MRTFFKIFRLAVAFLALIVTASFVSASQPPDEIINAAERGLEIFLVPTRLDFLKHFGFSDKADLDHARLGEPVEEFTLDQERLLDDSVPADLTLLGHSLKLWDFPVIVEGKAKALITVGVLSGKWEPVGFGGADLENQFQKIRVQWPISRGYSYKLYRQNGLHCSFVELAKGGKLVGIIPLTSFAKLLAYGSQAEINPLDIRSAKEVLSVLRAEYKKDRKPLGKAKGMGTRF